MHARSPLSHAQRGDQREASSVAWLAAAIAVVLAACSASPKSSLPSASTPGGSATPTAAAAATSLAPSRSAEPTMTGSAVCLAESLIAVGGRQGETGVAHGDVAFTNVGPAPCSLSGPPVAVALLRADGKVLPLQLKAPIALVGPNVVLEPGVARSAWLVVYWTNWCGPAPGPLRIRVVLPGGSGTVIAPFDGPPDGSYVARCDLPGQPSTLQSDVFGAGQ